MSAAQTERVSASRRAQAGLVWGLAVTAAELSSQPVQTTPLSSQLSLAAMLAFSFSLSGVTLALVLEPLSFRLRLPSLAVSLVALCLALGSVMTIALLNVARAFEPARAIFGERPDGLGVFLHTVFPQLFFGGLALAAYLLHRRDERTRSFIRRSVTAATQSEAARVMISARDLRGQIQPARIAEFVTEIRNRYRSDVDEGDILVERLTEFLRAAMPAVRSGRSSLAAEFETIERYHRLLACSRRTAPSWRLRRGSRAPEDVAFPPLLLLQVLEALPPSASPADVQLRTEGRDLLLEITHRGADLPTDWLPPELADQLRLAVAALHGQDAVLSIGAPDQPLQLRFTDLLPKPAYNPQQGVLAK